MTWDCKWFGLPGWRKSSSFSNAILLFWRPSTIDWVLSPTTPDPILVLEDFWWINLCFLSMASAWTERLWVELWTRVMELAWVPPTLLFLVWASCCYEMIFEVKSWRTPLAEFGGNELYDWKFIIWPLAAVVLWGINLPRLCFFMKALAWFLGTEVLVPFSFSDPFLRLITLCVL